MEQGQIQWIATETPFNAELPGGMGPAALPLAQSWPALIPPKKRERLQKILRKSSGIDMTRIERIPPIVLLEFLQRQWLKPMGELHSMDMEIWEKARENGLQTLGLESSEEHFGLLREISLEEQIRLLLQTTRNIRRSRKRLLHLHDLYSKENLPQLHRAAKRGMGKMRHKMLYARNLLMAERIAQLAAQSPGLAVVGAGHLSGGKGIIRLLKQRGYGVVGL